MFVRRWLRFMPDRSQLLLLFGALLVLFVATAFINLALMKQAALAEQAAAQARLEAAQARNSDLQAALEQAQRGQHIPTWAFRYFKLVLPGMQVVKPAPLPLSGATTDSSSRWGVPPYWTDWWHRLTQP